MSETPTSRKIGLAAMLDWVKSGLRYRCVFAFLGAALIMVVECGTVSAQLPINFHDRFLAGDTPFDVTAVLQFNFEQPPFFPEYDANSGGRPFTSDEIRVVTKVGDYLNDLIDSSYNRTVLFRYGDSGPGKRLPAGAGGLGGGGQITILSSYSVLPGRHDTQTISTGFESTVLHELGHELGITAPFPGYFDPDGDDGSGGPLPVDADIQTINGVLCVRFRGLVNPGYSALRLAYDGTLQSRYETIQVRTGVDVNAAGNNLWDERWYVVATDNPNNIPLRWTTNAAASALFGDQWVVGVTGSDPDEDWGAGGTNSGWRVGIAIDSNAASIGFAQHPWDPPGGTMTYRGARSFFSELELVLLQTGFPSTTHTIDRGRFYGSSIYQIHSIPIVNQANSHFHSGAWDPGWSSTGWTGDGTWGIGLHIARSDRQNRLNAYSLPSGTYYFRDCRIPDTNARGNRVIQVCDLISTGYLGTGIRMEGYNHNLTIQSTATVAARGDEGIGILTTMGSGTTLTNYGTIEATGMGCPAITRDTNGNLITINGVPTTVKGVFTTSGIIPTNGTPFWYRLDPQWLQELVANRADGISPDDTDLPDGGSGVGVWFQATSGLAPDNFSAAFNNYGTIRGSAAAIYIDNGFTVGGGTLNFYGGSVIEGNIISYNVPHNIDIARNPSTAVGTYDNPVSITGYGSTLTPTRVGDRLVGLIDLHGGTVSVQSSGNLSISAETAVAGVPVTQFGYLAIGTAADLNINSPMMPNPSHLTMANDSRLHVNLGTNQILNPSIPGLPPTYDLYDSDTIVVNGTANIGTIYIEVANPSDIFNKGLFTYALVAATNLTYTNDSAIITTPGNGNLLDYRAGERGYLDAHALNVENTLVLTIDLRIVPAGENTRLEWTGVNEYPDLARPVPDFIWDTDDERWNWSWGVDSTWFVDGDAVTFNLNQTTNPANPATHLVMMPNPVIVAEMLVSGNDNWTFSGSGNITGSTTATTLTGVTGGLTMYGTGTLTLNGHHEFEGDITLNRGRTVVGSTYSLTTQKDLYVGASVGVVAGAASLNLMSDGMAVAGGDIYVGYGNNSTGTVTLGVDSVLWTYGNVYIGSNVSSGTVTLGDDSFLYADGNVDVGGYSPTDPNPNPNQGTLAGTGTVMADMVTVYENGKLSAGNGRGNVGTLTINGDLTMRNYSRLLVDLVPWYQYDVNDVASHDPSIDYADKVVVTGTADIKNIDIDLSNLFPGGYSAVGHKEHTYTLITSAGLNYVPGSATISLNGDPIPLNSVGRWASIQVATKTEGNNLLLDITGSLENAYLLWTGNEGNNLWDFASVNWEHLMTGDPDAFVQGDTVVFWDTNTHEIDIVGTKKVVSDMYVEGGTWIFNGNIWGDKDSFITDHGPGSINGGLWINNADVILNGDDNEFGGGATVSSGGSLTLKGDLNVFNVLLETGGKLQIGNGGTTGMLDGNIFVDNGSGSITFNRNAPFLLFDFEGSITDSTRTDPDNGDGVASVTKRGNSTLWLLGENRYSGLTHIIDGAVFFGTKTNDIGAITVSSGVTLGGLSDANGDRATTITANGNVSNIGTIFSLADLIVTGNITNTGYLWNVTSIASDYFQNQGGVIVGTQEIHMGHGTFNNQGGTLVAGSVTGDPTQRFNFDQVGTLTIDGNFTSTSGTFVVGIDGVQNSTIKVLGDAVINGGLVSIEMIGSNTNYMVDKKYTFLTVDPGNDPNHPHTLHVNRELILDMSEFHGDLLGGLLKVVLRTDNIESYWLAFDRAFLYSGQGKTMNQRAVGRYIDQVGIYPGGDRDYLQVLRALDNAHAGLATEIKNAKARGETPAPPSMDPLYAALDQMGGSIYGTMTTASFQNMVMFHNTLANVLRRDDADPADVENNRGRRTYRGQAPPYGNRNGSTDDHNPSSHIWGMFYGNTGTMHSDGNAGKYSQGFSGIMVGYDRFNSKPQRYGLFLTMGGGNISGELQDRTRTTEFVFGPYLRQDTANTYVLMQAGLGSNNYDTKRRIVFGDPNDLNSYINRTAKNKHDAFVTTAHMEAGLKYRGGTLNLSPFVGAQYTGLSREAFTETGAGSLNLTTNKANYSSFRAMFGMRFDSKAFRFFKGSASFYGNAAWMYEFEQSNRRYTEFTARFNNTGLIEPSFTVHGNDPGRDWIQTGFGLNYDVTSYFRSFIGYDAYANTNQVMHSVNLGFVYQR